MVVSRRGFMKKGSLLLLAAGVSFGSADRIFGRGTDSAYPGPTQDNPAPFNFTKATFAPYVETVFRIFYPNSSKALTTTLVSIADIGPVPDTNEVAAECFVLQFRGTEALRQNTYRIDHQSLGSFELFLVPAGKNKKNFYYQAVINRRNA
jgi:Domain of unknown function (DUF6916)